MNELDAGKGRRAHTPLPDRIAANLAGNAARRRVAPTWSGPTAHDAVFGGDRGTTTYSTTPMHPNTAHTLTRLLRQQNNEQAATEVDRTQGYRW